MVKMTKVVTLFVVLATVGLFANLPRAESQSMPVLPEAAKALVLSTVAPYCPPGCDCTDSNGNYCGCGTGSPCKHSDCKAASTTLGCEACCNTGNLAEVYNCEQKCAAPV